MRIALVHNQYGVPSGEESMLYRIVDLLKQHGHKTYLFTKSSQGIADSLSQQMMAFLSGIYSIQSRRQMRTFLEESQPDIVQVQNLYPLISPSVLMEIKKHQIPIVMRCANYRLLCPNGLLLSGAKVCHRCLSGGEWWCVLKNCERNLFKSAGYALRHYVGRRFRWFHRCVDYYYTQTRFQKAMLVENGFEEHKIHVIPNMVSCHQTEYHPGDYIAYLGRISKEKGFHLFLAAAQRLPHIPFQLAGSISSEDFSPDQLPDNVEYIGYVEKEDKERFLRNAAMCVMPSICYEGFPSTILEAMSQKTPVISSAIGGLPEIVQHGQTGLLFEPGNVDALTASIQALWGDGFARMKMGEAGYEMVKRDYSFNGYYDRLMEVYRQAMGLSDHNLQIHDIADPFELSARSPEHGPIEATATTQ